jgi:hypothetical protein
VCIESHDITVEGESVGFKIATSLVGVDGKSCSICGKEQFLSYVVRLI